MKENFSRRDFLKYGAVTGAAVSAAAFLAGCGSAAAPAATNAPATEAPAATEAPEETAAPVADNSPKKVYYRVNGANILEYQPADMSSPNARILCITMHGGLGRTLENSFMKQMSTLGFRGAYCVPDNASFVNQFQYLSNCIKMFREMEDIDKIVLMGQSRGAAVASGYQRIAENGAQTFQGPDRLLAIPDMELEPADGLMILDGNFGFTIMHVMSLNPAITDESNPLYHDPEYDATLPENGYGPDGTCNYTDEFKHKFLMKQRERYNKLLDLAKERWEKIQAGEGMYTDDEPFIVPDMIGTNNSPKLFAGDLKYFSHTKEAWPLIHKDGSITTEVIPCVRIDENNPSFSGTSGASFQTTVKEFLYLACEVGEDYDYGEDYLTGVNMDNCLTISSGNVKFIKCPLLAMGHTAGYEYINAEWVYNNAASEDKSIAFTEGAKHGFSSIDKELYGDTLATECNFIAQWLTEPGRFV